MAVFLDSAEGVAGGGSHVKNLQVFLLVAVSGVAVPRDHPKKTATAAEYVLRNEY